MTIFTKHADNKRKCLYSCCIM